MAARSWTEILRVKGGQNAPLGVSKASRGSYVDSGRQAQTALSRHQARCLLARAADLEELVPGDQVPVPPFGRLAHFHILRLHSFVGMFQNAIGRLHASGGGRLGIDHDLQQGVGGRAARLLHSSAGLRDGGVERLPIVPWCVEQVRRGGSATIYANVHVGVGDRDAAAPQARRDLFSYAVVDAYARSFTQAGFGDAVLAIRAAHLAGDRAAAVGAVSDQMIDAIDVVGSPELVGATIAAYRDAGVQVPVVFPVTWGAAGTDEAAAVEATLRAAAPSWAPLPGRTVS